jgi:hypothetical protein
VAAILSLREAIGWLVADGQTVALEGFAHRAVLPPRIPIGATLRQKPACAGL